MKKNKKLGAAARRAYLEELALARISIRLGDALRDSGRTQRELADELGISEARVSQIFAVEGNPTVKTLVRIADGLGCEFDVVIRRRSQELPRAPK